MNQNVSLPNAPLPPYTVETWPIGRPQKYERNARTHSPRQLAQLRDSFRKFGQVWPILVREDGTIIAGHGRIEAAKAEGMAEIRVIVATGWTEEQCRAFGLLDNKVAINSDWDETLLATELAELSGFGVDLGMLGFDPGEVAALSASEADAGQTDADDVPELPKNPVTLRGDIWGLGSHRLLCGDSGIRGDIEKLRAGAYVDMIVTDPPYSSGGRQDGGKRNSTSIGTRGNARMARDNLTTKGYLALMANVLSNVEAETAYIFTDWRMWTWTYDALEGGGYPVRNMLVWDKNRMGMGFPWRSQHELIAFAKRGAGSMGDGKAGNVLRCDRQPNELHPTQKPTELMERLIANTPGKVVLDPFVGSGTTLIAAHAAERQFLGVEIDPAYCDVCIHRWQDFTGQQATLDGDGRTFDEVKAERERAAA